MNTEQRPRRARGEGTIHWSAERGRYVATKIVGYDGRGKRITKTGIGRSESEAKRNLRVRVQAHEAGMQADWDHVTVSKIVEQWLDLGRSNVGARTKEGNEEHYLNHIKPHLGGRKIKDLRTDEVERWLLDLSPKLSTSTLKQVKSVLNRSIVWAMKRGYAERNVVEIASVPKGRPGRASRSLNLQQAEDILSKTRDHKMYAYIVVSLLTGLRPEETRALAWNHVYLDGTNEMPPHINVWRSVRVGGDTKTPKSRRSIALSGLVVAALKKHRLDQVEARNAAGSGGRSRDSCSRRTWGHSRTGTTSCACSATLSGSCRR